MERSDSNPDADPAADVRKARAETRKRNRSRELRRQIRHTRLAWRDKIFNQLTAGLPVSVIALQEGKTPRRMREIIQRILDERRKEPCEHFAQLQMARLNDALICARTAMMHGNIKAIDRVITVVRELDRYQTPYAQLIGETSAAAALPAPITPALPPPTTPALPAPQKGETTGNGAASD